MSGASFSNFNLCAALAPELSLSRRTIDIEGSEGYHYKLKNIIYTYDFDDFKTHKTFDSANHSIFTYRSVALFLFSFYNN